VLNLSDSRVWPEAQFKGKKVAEEETEFED
jgi:hypothetical protein